MKSTRVLCFVYLLTTAIFFSACTQTPNQTDSAEVPEASSTADNPAETEPADNISEKWITPVEKIGTEGMNLFWQYDNLQFAADENAKLSIYVKAEKDENGELLLDDGQDWLVIMETLRGNYPLFPQEYIQLGNVSCVVYNEYINNETVISHVLVTVQQTAGYKIYDCIFDTDKNAFKVIPIYDAKGINFICNSR